MVRWLRAAAAAAAADLLASMILTCCFPNYQYEATVRAQAILDLGERLSAARQGHAIEAQEGRTDPLPPSDAPEAPGLGQNVAASLAEACDTSAMLAPR